MFTNVFLKFLSLFYVFNFYLNVFYIYDRYRLPAGPTAANPPRAAAAVDRWDRRTDTVSLHRSIADRAISVDILNPSNTADRQKKISLDSYRWWVVVPRNCREDGAAKRPPCWLSTRQEQYSDCLGVWRDVCCGRSSYSVTLRDSRNDVINNCAQDSQADKTAAQTGWVHRARTGNKKWSHRYICAARWPLESNRIIWSAQVLRTEI